MERLSHMLAVALAVALALLALLLAAFLVLLVARGICWLIGGVA